MTSNDDKLLLAVLSQQDAASLSNLNIDYEKLAIAIGSKSAHSAYERWRQYKAKLLQNSNSVPATPTKEKTAKAKATKKSGGKAKKANGTKRKKTKEDSSEEEATTIVDSEAEDSEPKKPRGKKAKKVKGVKKEIEAGVGGEVEEDDDSVWNEGQSICRSQKANNVTRIGV